MKIYILLIFIGLLFVSTANAEVTRIYNTTDGCGSTGFKAGSHKWVGDQINISGRILGTTTITAGFRLDFSSGMTGSARVAIFDLDANGVPDNHLYTSNITSWSGITYSQQWQNFTFNSSVTLPAGVYFFGIGSDDTTTELGVCRRDFSWNPRNGTTYYSTTTELTNGKTIAIRIFGDYPSPSPSDTVTFIAPTPINGNTSDVQVQIAWNSTTNRSDFYFGTTNPPTVRYFENVTNNNNTYAWMTNVTADGTYYYMATLPSNTTVNTTVRNWTYDTTDPVITLNPSNAFNSSNQTHNRYTDLLQFNITLTDNIDLFGFQVNVTHSNGTEKYSYTNESLSGTTFNFINSVNVTTWQADNYIVKVLGSDSHTAKRINDYRVSKTTNKVEFNTDEGNLISVATDDDAQLDAKKEEIDRYNFDVIFSDEQKKSRTFHIRAEDGKTLYYQQGSGFKAHFVVWNPNTKKGNWIDFEGVNGVPIVIKVTDSHYKVIYVDLDGGRKYVFNSIGGLNVNEEHFLWEHSTLSVEDVSITPSQASPDDDLLGYCRASEGLGYGVSYNWTWFQNNSLWSSGSSGPYTENVSINLNNISSASVVEGANWTFSCQGASAYNTGVELTAYVNSSVVPVVPIIINTCGVGSAIYPVLNMTYFDDESGGAITLSNGVDLTFNDGVNTLNHEKVYTGNITDSLCTNVNPVNRTYSWNMYGTLNLQKDDYATRLWLIDSADPFNISNNPIYELPLYLIPLNDSSTVNYNWFTTGFQPIDGIMHVYKCEQDGTRTLIESAPITDGNSLANIELLNTPYSYEIYTGGKTYTNNVSYTQCHLESQTDITYYVDVSGTDYGSQIGLYSVQCSVTKSGQDVQVNWSSNPEDDSAITGCIQAYRDTSSGQVLIYENCTSTGFSITRTIPNNTNSYYAKGKLYQAGYSIECPNVAYFPSVTTAQQSFGLTAVFAVVIFIMSLVLIYHGDGEGTLIAAVIGVLITAFLGIIIMPWTLAVSIISFLVIIVAIGGNHK